MMVQRCVLAQQINTFASTPASPAWLTFFCRKTEVRYVCNDPRPQVVWLSDRRHARPVKKRDQVTELSNSGSCEIRNKYFEKTELVTAKMATEEAK